MRLLKPMTIWPIITLQSETEGDIVAVRQRARRIAELLGFESQEQTRIATAVSEIARNAFVYAGGGRAEFTLEPGRELQAVGVVHLHDHVRRVGRAALQRLDEGPHRQQALAALGISLESHDRPITHGICPTCVETVELDAVSRP